jgi:hypothetical protein
VNNIKKPEPTKSEKKSELTDSELEGVQGGMRNLTIAVLQTMRYSPSQSTASLDPSPDDDFDPPVTSYSA